MDAFSAHGDQAEMLAFLDNQDRTLVEQIFLVHGDAAVGEAFTVKLHERGFENVLIPMLGEEFAF
jgi:Cft2 family RNA processing exonuclease